jgi:hypothetical protein
MKRLSEGIKGKMISMEWIEEKEGRVVKTEKEGGDYIYSWEY